MLPLIDFEYSITLYIILQNVPIIVLAVAERGTLQLSIFDVYIHGFVRLLALDVLHLVQKGHTSLIRSHIVPLQIDLLIRLEPKLNRVFLRLLDKYRRAKRCLFPAFLFILAAQVHLSVLR